MYLLKISITHNQKRIHLLNFLINCTSARSAPQILFIKGEGTFLFQNFLIIGLCNSSALSLFKIFSFLTADLFPVAKVSDHARVTAASEGFLSKNL